MPKSTVIAVTIDLFCHEYVNTLNNIIYVYTFLRLCVLMPRAALLRPAATSPVHGMGFLDMSFSTSLGICLTGNFHDRSLTPGGLAPPAASSAPSALLNLLGDKFAFSSIASKRACELGRLGLLPNLSFNFELMSSRSSLIWAVTFVSSPRNSLRWEM